MSRMNLPGHVRQVTIYSLMFTNACCLVVGLGLRLGFVSARLAVIHTHTSTMFPCHCIIHTTSACTVIIFEFLY